jgi:neutral ceramidase
VTSRESLPLFAGAARLDVTPAGSVWMDGMIREHPSTGVHDSLFARCLVVADSPDPAAACAIVAVDVCALDEATTAAARLAAAERSGIPAARILVAATHTHSGPATYGFFCQREDAYVTALIERIGQLVATACAGMQAVTIACGSAVEDTISHYRRLLGSNGRVIMNWEPFQPEQIVRPLGIADTEAGVLKVVAAKSPGHVIAVLFNHAGHPNVMSGDNYLLSSDYPGYAARLLEEQLGGVALFVNGAQGSVDIDGLRHRDWVGVERAGSALARAVAGARTGAVTMATPTVLSESIRYTVPARRISEVEWAWAQEVLAQTGGKVEAHADGIGDDYLAVLYQELRSAQDHDIPVEQTGLVVGECALLTFPGELYTEIGMAIKQCSPFRYTWLLGLANGYVGYIPTARAIGEGGYAEDTRRVDSPAGEMIMRQSLGLLQSLYERSITKKGALSSGQEELSTPGH